MSCPMLVALDDEDRGDPSIPRVADPELRSRLVGYLGRGWLARPGYRTDGVWVWPESLAERVRVDGVGPCLELFRHILARGALLPPEPPADAVDAAASATAVTHPRDAPGAVYRAATALGADSPTDLLRMRPAATTTGVAESSWLTPTSWRDADDIPAGLVRRSVPAHDVLPAVARALADELTRGWHAELLARGRESITPGDGPRPAPVFDSVGPSGGPLFSPVRARVVEPERRMRLVRYLSQAPMVLRATGRMPDPLGADAVPRVPLSFRTDGVWVWCEASAYYLDTRGVAPELELLCHIEEQACVLPGVVAEDVVRQAGVRAQQAGILAQQPAVPLRPTVARYFSHISGALFRRWDSLSRPDVLDTDLRWRRCAGDWTLPWHEVVEISEADAARAVDARWALVAN